MNEPNAALGWKYRALDLSGITNPLWVDPVKPSESYDWCLHRIQCSYDSNGDDPSLFDTIQWSWGIPPRDQVLQDLSDQKPRPPISLCLNYGINDLTAGTTRPKEFFFPSPEINWIIQANEYFNFQVENQSALTGTVRILYLGSYIMPKPIVNQYV